MPQCSAEVLFCVKHETWKLLNCNQWCFNWLYIRSTKKDEHHLISRVLLSERWHHCDACKSSLNVHLQLVKPQSVNGYPFFHNLSSQGPDFVAAVCVWRQNTDDHQSTVTGLTDGWVIGWFSHWLIQSISDGGTDLGSVCLVPIVLGTRIYFRTKTKAWEKLKTTRNPEYLTWTPVYFVPT